LNHLQGGIKNSLSQCHEHASISAMNHVYITEALRTPIGKFNGALSSLSSDDLAACVVSEISKKNGINAVDDLIFGNVLQAGQGQNIARQVSRRVFGDSVPGTTVNKVCGSGLHSVIFAAQSIALGDADAVIAGGTESMSNSPYLVPKARQGFKMGHQSLIDSMIQDGLWDNFYDIHMGITAENIARHSNITRQAQDAFAAESHRRATQAQSKNIFNSEIVPVSIPQRKGDPVVVNHDEGPRAESTEDALSTLRPVFEKDGSVTAGNASSINDGAAAILLQSEASLSQSSATPLARVVSYATAGIDPAIMGLGPIDAINKALAKAGWSYGDVDLVELNEAFAVQSLGVLKEVPFNTDIVNVNGGAIALGHPIGASGSRILVTLLHEMSRRGAKKGLASLCIGGGMGIALCVEAV
jgi:acetyl-CoA C-acetyltransferase